MVTSRQLLHPKQPHLRFRNHQRMSSWSRGVPGRAAEAHRAQAHWKAEEMEIHEVQMAKLLCPEATSQNIL
jgi:hypothetical protein